MQDYYEALVDSTREYVLQSGLLGAIVGISGGVDSALTLKIAVDALGRDKVNALLMPSRYTSKESNSIAIELANNLGVKYHVLGIDGILNALKEVEGLAVPSEGIVEQNMQARIRGLILMSMSNKSNQIVFATGNRSEILTGYSTLYGDTCGGYAPLKYVYKTEVYELANWCNECSKVASYNPDKGLYFSRMIPDFIINREPTAELKFNQLDVHSLPPYHILDNILRKMVDLNFTEAEVAADTLCDLETIIKIKGLVSRYAYKRLQYPDGPNFKAYKSC